MSDLPRSRAENDLINDSSRICIRSVLKTMKAMGMTTKRRINSVISSIDWMVIISASTSSRCHHTLCMCSERVAAELLCCSCQAFPKDAPSPQKYVSIFHRDTNINAGSFQFRPLTLDSLYKHAELVDSGSTHMNECVALQESAYF